MGLNPVRTNIRGVPGFRPAIEDQPQPQLGTSPAAVGTVVYQANQNPAGSATTTVYTVPAGVFHRQGNTLVIAASSNGKSIGSVADSRSAGFSVDATANDGLNIGGGVISCRLPFTLVPGDTVTITWAGGTTGARGLIITEMAGMLISSGVDTGVVASNTFAAATSFSLAPTAATTNDDIIFGFGVIDQTGSGFSTGNGYTLGTQGFLTSGTNRNLYTGYQTVTSGSTPPNWTLSWTGSATSGAFLVAYKSLPIPVVTGSAYTDSGTAAFVLTASSVETAQFVDADTPNYVLTASATEVHTTFDSGTAAWVMTPSSGLVANSAIIQTFDSGSLSGSTTTTVIPVPAGGVGTTNTLLVFGTKGATTGCTDSKGNTYTSDGSVVGSGTSMGVTVWRKDPGGTALTSADSITLTHNNAGGRVGIAVEVSGFLGSPLEGSVTNTYDNNGTSQTSASYNGSAATSSGFVRVFGVWCLDLNASSPVAGSGQTIEAQQASSVTVRTLVIEDQIVQAGTTPTNAISWTGASTQQTSILLAYDVASTGGGDIAQFVDSGTPAWVMTASATENFAHLDADTGAWILTASATEVHTIFDSATAAYVLTASALEEHDTYDTGTAAFILTASSTDTAQFVDAATGAFILTASGTDIHTTFDAGTAAYVLTASAAEEHDIFDSATAAYVLTASTVLEEHDIFDAATVSWAMTASGTDVAAYVDSATAAWVLTGSATTPEASVEAATASYVLTASATETAQFVDAATASYVSVISIVEANPNVEAATAAWVMTTSYVEQMIFADTATAAYVLTASSTEEHDIFDAATANYILTASASPEGKEWSDSATAAYVLTTSATELHTSFDAATAAWVLTGSATVELHTILDSGTAAFVLTASTSSELYAHADVATAAWVMTSSAGVEKEASVDSGTAAWVMTFSSFEEFGKIDSATAQWVLVASASPEGIQRTDAGLAFWVMTTTSTNTESYYVDADTAIWAMTGSSFNEEQGGQDMDTPLWGLVASATDTADFVDSDTAAYVLTPKAVDEHKEILDYYLTATQKRQWSTSQTHKWDVVQTNHYPVAQSRRWGVHYRGRGFFSG